MIGEMWKQESQDVKDHYQALAQQSREQHQRDYPGYKYAPRRPGERKRRNVRQEIVYGDCDSASNTEESVAYDGKSPIDFGMSPTPSGEYFRFVSNGSYYSDMLGVTSGVDSSSDEYNLSQFPPSQHTTCVTSTPELDHSWANTPPLDQTPELCLDAGHQDMEYDGTNAYGIYQGMIIYDN